jgi:hypothetical protein
LVLCVTGCSEPITLTKYEVKVASDAGIEQPHALLVKRVTGGTVLPLFESRAEEEKIAIETALKTGKTEGERGELLAHSMLDPRHKQQIGIQTQLPADTTDDTANSYVEKLRGELPPNLVPKYLKDGNRKLIAVQKSVGSSAP